MDTAFVARENELARLHLWLDQAVQGQGTSCFLVGSAGSGKSTLFQHFAHEAEAKHEGLLTVSGMCDAASAMQDAYLPFRDLLNVLTGSDPRSKPVTGESRRRLDSFVKHACEALLEFGPDLIGSFVPFAKVLAKMSAWGLARTPAMKRLRALGEKAPLSDLGAVNQSQLVEQYVNYLHRVSAQAPLLLFVDDLQWCDQASAGLLFRLVRRLGDARILLVAAFRPEEIAARQSGARHHLDKVFTEIKRYQGDVWLDLDQARVRTGRAFVDDLLDSEANLLDEKFRAEFYARTGGHPLFSVELLRYLKESGALRTDVNGRWMAAEPLSWDHLPTRVEGLIEERIARLDDTLRQYATVGSVEGELFTAEVVAEVAGNEARAVVAGLSGAMQREHMLITSDEVQRLSGHRLSRYRFVHNLIRTYLYEGLDEAERSYLHEDVGTALEALYGTQADLVAVQLARHFMLAGLPERAFHWHRRSGELAASRFAHDVAIEAFSAALDAAPANDPGLCFELLAQREQSLNMLGDRTRQRADLDRMAQLAEQSGNPEHRVSVLLRRGWFEQDRSEFAAAAAVARDLLTMLPELTPTKPEEGAARLADVRLLLCKALWHMGDLAEALRHGESALEIAETMASPAHSARIRLFLGMMHYRSDNSEGARACFEEALRGARQSNDRRLEAAALNTLGIVETNPQAARRAYEEALAIARAVGDRKSEGDLLTNIAEGFHNEGDYAQAITRGADALAVIRDIEDRRNEAIALLNLGESYRLVGQYAQSLDLAKQALDLARAIHFPFIAMHALENMSDSALPTGDAQDALSYALEALDLATQLNDAKKTRNVLLCCAAALLQLEQLDEAEAAYRQAGETTKGTSDEADAERCTVAAALADLLVRRNTPAARAEAQQLAEELVTLLLRWNDPFANPIPAACYASVAGVLEHLSHPQAAEWRTRARDLLTLRASWISDRALRESFLHNVPAHAALLATA